MTNEEAIINGVDFEETVSEFELLFDEWHNKEFCTMTRIRDYAEYYKEENAKLKAEIDRLNGKSEMYRDMADSFFNSNFKLKAEIKQLKATISKMETTTAQEDDLK